VILETERLTLTAVTAADAVLVQPIMADPEVMAHWDVAEIGDPDVIDQVLAGQIEAMAAEKAFHWAMRLTADGTFLGLCEVSDVDRRHHRAEVGFILGKDCWGKGYAYEAMQAVMNYAATQGLQRLWARTQVGNDASEKLLTKLGFEQEGYMRGHVDREGERRDVRLWGLLL
jgi:ribosomal-protein-alanine N-acetyltransferase